MKTLNETFTDKEFTRMKKAKDFSKANSWHEWIIMLVKVSELENGR